MECYYENEDLYRSSTKEGSLPILLYFNIIRHIVSSLRHDPLPRLLLIEYFRKLNYGLREINHKMAFELGAELNVNQPSFTFDYRANYEADRVLIWGGLYQLIQSDPVLSNAQKESLSKYMLSSVKDSLHRESCFEPFLRIQPEEMPPVIPSEPADRKAPSAGEPATNASQQNEPVTDEPQSSETVSEEPLTNVSASEVSSEENRLLDYVKLDDLLEQAAQHYFNNDTFIQSLNTLLTLMVNKQSGGDPNIHNLLQAKLKLFNQKVKHLQEVEKKQHATPQFIHLILHPNPKKLLRRLHQLIDGKSGAAVGAVLLRAQQKGYLSRVPTKAQFESEFILNGGWNAIQNYMNDNNDKALAKANQIIIFKGE